MAPGSAPFWVNASLFLTGDKSLIGSVDLISDNTDLLEDTGRRRAMLALYA